MALADVGQNTSSQSSCHNTSSRSIFETNNMLFSTCCDRLSRFLNTYVEIELWPI